MPAKIKIKEGMFEEIQLRDGQYDVTPSATKRFTRFVYPDGTWFIHVKSLCHGFIDKRVYDFSNFPTWDIESYSVPKGLKIQSIPKGTVTGRFSSDTPNISNVPRSVDESKLKEVVIVVKDDYAFGHLYANDVVRVICDGNHTYFNKADCQCCWELENVAWERQKFFYFRKVGDVVKRYGNIVDTITDFNINFKDHIIISFKSGNTLMYYPDKPITKEMLMLPVEESKSENKVMLKDLRQKWKTWFFAQRYGVSSERIAEMVDKSKGLKVGVLKHRDVKENDRLKHAAYEMQKELLKKREELHISHENYGRSLLRNTYMPWRLEGKDSAVFISSIHSRGFLKKGFTISAKQSGAGFHIENKENFSYVKLTGISGCYEGIALKDFAINCRELEDDKPVTAKGRRPIPINTHSTNDLIKTNSVIWLKYIGEDRKVELPFSITLTFDYVASTTNSLHNENWGRSVLRDAYMPWRLENVKKGTIQERENLDIKRKDTLCKYKDEWFTLLYTKHSMLCENSYNDPMIKQVSNCIDWLKGLLKRENLCGIDSYPLRFVGKDVLWKREIEFLVMMELWRE